MGFWPLSLGLTMPLLPPSNNSKRGALPAGAAANGGLSALESPRRQLLQAAMAEAVSDYGYHATTISDIVQRSGVSQGAFRREFASKEQCFLAAFDSLNQRFAARIVSAYRGPSTDPGDRS